MNGIAHVPLASCAWIPAGLMTAIAARWLDDRLDLLLDHGLAAILAASGAAKRPRAGFPGLEIGALLLMGSVSVAARTAVQMEAAMIFSAALLLCAWIDWRNRILPDLVVVPLLAAGLVLAAGWQPFVAGGQAVAGALLGGGMAFLTRRLGQGLRGRFGAGDIKFIAAIGAWLGPEAVALVLLVASMLAGIAIFFRRRASRRDPLCFGPALATGSFLYLLVVLVSAETGRRAISDMGFGAQLWGR